MSGRRDEYNPLSSGFRTKCPHSLFTKAGMVKALVVSVVIVLSLYLALFFTVVEFGPNRSGSGSGSGSESAELLELEPPLKPAPSWLINDPIYFYERPFDGSMKDVRQSPAEIALFEDFTVNFSYDEGTDYEAVDALEQFFWGQKGGLCIELGAVDGGETTHSQTYDYEKRFGWRRILVEGNPTHREKLLETSPKSFVASTAVCKDTTKLHYLNRGLVSGIAEFMTDDFLKNFYPPLYKSMVPEGNLSSVDWNNIPAVMPDLTFEVIDCVPMGTILRQAKASHVNYFILDVEGAELQILETIDWRRVKFDVICIEIDPYYRPVGNTDKIVRFMASKGYLNYSGLIGRNIWFVRNDFIPKKRPSNALPDDDKKKYREKDLCFRRACPRPW